MATRCHRTVRRARPYVPTMTTRSRRALLAFASLALLAGACGDDDEDAATPATAEAPVATEPADETSEEAPYDGGGTTGEGSSTGIPIELATTDLGDILTSGGRTLYVFTPDEAGPSTCYDDCAQVWPPLAADGEVMPAEGVDAALFGTTPRDGGGEQVTVDGWPLYFFASDAAPGDTNGQGVGGNWWVVGAEGQPIMG